MPAGNLLLGQPTNADLGGLFNPTSSVSVSGGMPLFSTDPASSLGLVTFSSLAGNEQLIATGTTVIAVNWSVSVNIKGVFSRPKNRVNRIC